MPDLAPFDPSLRSHRSLFLYLETCAVDNRGDVDTANLSPSDIETAEHWHDSGFITFRRIRSACITRSRSMNVSLSDDAWLLVSSLRSNRANRVQRNHDDLTRGRLKNA